MNTINLKKEDSLMNNIIDENIYFEVIYKQKKDNHIKTKIFDIDFINKNKDKCKIIYPNQEYELKEYFEDIEIENNYKDKKEISIILKINKNITDISYMFYECEELLLIKDKRKINNSNNDTLSLSDIQNEINNSYENEENYEIFNQNNQNNLYKYFEDDKKSLSTIANKNTSNIFLTNNLYDKDNLIKSSEYYNFYNISDISCMFNGCESLISLPDISKWNISNVTDMSDMFRGCKSLISLPDISKWNISNVTSMSSMFSKCESLISLPDISKWNTSKVIYMSNMFWGCKSLTSLPKISEWNTYNVTDMSDMFRECSSLMSLPEITVWNTSNVTDMKGMFYGCGSLISFPDISKWNTSNVNDIDFMFYGCINCLNIFSNFFK